MSVFFSVLSVVSVLDVQRVNVVSSNAETFPPKPFDFES